LLEGPIDEVLRVLTADTDDAQAMRQTSPLTFVLSQRARYEIWKATRQNDPRAA
jgi:hypothetical protein